MGTSKTNTIPHDPKAWPNSPRPSVEQILRAVQITSLTRELDLSYARGLTPRSLKALLKCVPNLRQLTIRHTQIGHLPDVFAYVPELRELDVSDNKLSELPASIGALSKLQHLSVTGNRLEALPASLGRLHNLRFLNASSNRIATLGREIAFCKALRVLRLASNRLSELPPGIGELPHLQLLQLAFNRLRRLPGELSHATELRVLNVAFNALSTLPDNLVDLVHLVQLDLTGNDIVESPACLAHMKTVRVRGLEHPNWLISAGDTQVTTGPAPRPNLLWSDAGAARTREINLSSGHTARTVIGNLRRVFDTMTGHTKTKTLGPPEKAKLQRQAYKGQLDSESKAADEHVPTRVSADTSRDVTRHAAHPKPRSES